MPHIISCLTCHVLLCTEFIHFIHSVHQCNGLRCIVVTQQALPAIIAVFYSTKCGSNRYLNEWGRTYTKISGLQGFNRVRQYIIIIDYAFNFGLNHTHW
jgi:hypothetical protein